MMTRIEESPERERKATCETWVSEHVGGVCGRMQTFSVAAISC